ncbi:MAG: TIGR00730 family Rossman fold protein [Chloroflexi bacterium]|nr:TIGR00730 family Rossman fold protein [Chloroflexota bacterium]
MKSICVYCGSSDNVHPDYLAAARQMGATLTQRGLRLIYGGGKTGLMGAVADGAIQAGGEVIGVIIPSMNTPALAQIGLTRMDVTPSMHARKARMHELADGFVALPGGFGTFDELFETLTWAQIGEHNKPVGLLDVRDYFQPLLKMIEHAEKEGFIFSEHREGLLCKPDPEALLDAMANHHLPEEAVKRWMRQ